MYMIYADGSILAGPDLKEIEKTIEDIKTSKLDITIEGDIKDFLEINIDCKPYGTIHFTKPNLVDYILDDLKMEEDVIPKTTTDDSYKLL